MNNNTINEGYKPCTDGRNMACLLRNIVSGYDTYIIVYRSLEAKYEPFFTALFQSSYINELEGKA